MNEISDILRKANVKAVASYLLYGRDIPQSDDLTYEERNNIAFAKCIQSIDSDPDQLETAVSEFGAELSLLFFEIGVKAGVRLAIDIVMGENQDEKRKKQL